MLRRRPGRRRAWTRRSTSRARRAASRTCGSPRAGRRGARATRRARSRTSCTCWRPRRRSLPPTPPDRQAAGADPAVRPAPASGRLPADDRRRGRRARGSRPRARRARPDPARLGARAPPRRVDGVAAVSAGGSSRRRRWARCRSPWSASCSRSPRSCRRRTSAAWQDQVYCSTPTSRSCRAWSPTSSTRASASPARSSAATCGAGARAATASSAWAPPPTRTSRVRGQRRPRWSWARPTT